MTKEQKMKKYTNAIRRRLDLPKDLKDRVMSDLLSSIAARRESGMSDEAIYAELGSPRKAASDINEQMKEFTYRKSPWRFLFAVLAVLGAMELLGSLAALMLYLMLRDPVLDAASIGIIGGADGPTAVFVTTPGWTGYVLPVLMVAAGIMGYLRLRRCKRKK